MKQKDKKSKEQGKNKPPLPINGKPGKDFPETKGLCVNCDKRDTCHHRKQLGGVWFCELYE
jgi:hypothetical protein